jgi:hypothetical protein
MFLGRLRSLNSLGGTRDSRWWKKILGGHLPSPDTLGRVPARVDPGRIRQTLIDFCRDLRKKKALPRLANGLVALVFDGHESTSSFLRQCPGCAQRRVGKEDDPRIQYYHRFVFCSLVGADFHVFVDVEPIRPGEGEVVAARRLYDRVHPLLSRSYDLVLGDGLYLEGPFFQDAIDRGKEVMAVLKREDLNLFEDAEALFEEMEPVTFKRRGRLNRCWDLEGFTSFPTVDRPLRVLKALETSKIERQRTGEMEEKTIRWMWATTMSTEQASSRETVEVGRSRWDIENRGFNEGVNAYGLNHVYRHEPNAMIVVFLLAMLAMNLFSFFYRRNLKPEVRERHSMLAVSRMVKGDLFLGLVPQAAPS